MGRLDGKVAIITGSNSGVGAATAKLFAKEGAKVVISARRLPQLEEVAAQIKADGGDVLIVQTDVSKREDAENLVAKTVEAFGKVDVLVNNAGVLENGLKPIDCVEDEDIDWVFGINTKGTMFLTQAVAKEMLKNTSENGIKGHICNISSISAYTSSVNRGEYCISKAGVSMLTKLFADRLAEEGIMVNEILPGIIATSMTEKVKGKYDALIDGGLLPIKRWGQPEDIAEAVYTLVSGKLPYMTGQSINIDGGFHIRRL